MLKGQSPTSRLLIRTTGPEEPQLDDDPLWYKDAIIYQLHVRAFYDSIDDGIGDFAGLTQKLDYLQDLGVTALWVQPFYPSPLKDDGYDISDYTNVNPAYGNLKEFKVFLREAHARGLRVITELVLNHTSDQHPWFQRARRAKPGSAERDFYVWSDTPEKYQDARIIFKDFEPSNWSWAACRTADRCRCSPRATMHWVSTCVVAPRRRRSPPGGRPSWCLRPPAPTSCT
jgi:maltose alpha-D-glucosyltransferase/alpha-amylase